MQNLEMKIFILINSKESISKKAIRSFKMKLIKFNFILIMFYKKMIFYINIVKR